MSKYARVISPSSLPLPAPPSLQAQEDDELLGSAASASEDQAVEEEADTEGEGGMAGPWLVRFPKCGDVCFIALEAVTEFDLGMFV